MFYHRKYSMHGAIFALAALCCLPVRLIAAPAVGDTVFAERPGDPEARGKWTAADWATSVPEGPGGRVCLRVDAPKAAPVAAGSVQQDVMGKPIKLQAGRFELERPLDLAHLRGWRVDVTARIRTEGVPVPELPWEGIRLGLYFKTGAADYGANAYGMPSRNEWHEVALRHMRIPADATDVKLFAGLISTAGTLWVDDIRIVLTEPPLAELAARRSPYAAQTRWRGSNLGTVKDEWLHKLAREWNVNFIKWWIRLPSPDLPEAEYAAQLEPLLVKLDDALNRADAAGVRIVPQISTAYDAWRVKSLGNTDRVFLEPAVADRFVASWQIIARRYAGRKTIHGYDLMNEAVLRAQPAPGCPDYEALMERTAQAINAIDPQAGIIVQPEEWWGVTAFSKLRPIRAKNVTYSVHMYAPFELTHQGVSSRKHEGISYPGMVKGRMWDKEALRRAMQPAKDFQLAYGVPMQVGEFSCIRWAPDGSAARWLKDCIDLFEEFGWDWMYHGVLDFDGWSVELGEDPANLGFLRTPAAAKQVLLSGFARNGR